MIFLILTIHQNRRLLWLRPRLYSAPPDPLAGFKAAASRQERNGGEGKGKGGEWGMGKGGKKGDVGRGIAPWLLGG